MHILKQSGASVVAAIVVVGVAGGGNGGGGDEDDDDDDDDDEDDDDDDDELGCYNHHPTFHHSFLPLPSTPLQSNPLPHHPTSTFYPHSPHYPPSEIFVAHCVARAESLTDSKLATIVFDALSRGRQTSPSHHPHLSIHSLSIHSLSLPCHHPHLSPHSPEVGRHHPLSPPTPVHSLASPLAFFHVAPHTYQPTISLAPWPHGQHGYTNQ